MFDQATIEMLLEGVVDTLYMTLVSTFFSYVFGMMMGTVLVICRQDGITPRPMIYAVLDVVVNLTRSFPFLILMIAVIPACSEGRPSATTPRSSRWSSPPRPSWPGLWNPPCSKWTAASLRRRSPWGRPPCRSS